MTDFILRGAVTSDSESEDGVSIVLDGGGGAAAATVGGSLYAATILSARRRNSFKSMSR